MKSVRVSRRANRDLTEIYKYIASDNLAAADKLFEKLVAVFDLLAEMPRLGRTRPDVGKDIRYFPVSSYNIFYRLKYNEVHIVRVIHGRRDLWDALHY